MLRLPSLLPFLLLLSDASPQPPFPSRCSERCGEVQIPFPFHLSPSCGPKIDAFRLFCRNDANSTTPSLFLTLESPFTDLRVVRFFPTGSLLVDSSRNASSSSPSCDRQYFHANDSALFRSRFFGVSSENVLRLYDCEDSSVCKAGCGKAGGGVGGCEGNGSFSGCCYPLSDGSVWKLGDEFSVFSEFGCRGFSSWVDRGSTDDGVAAERGLEIEWAVPKDSGNGSVCADKAVVVNATAVEGGVRCVCEAGFVGDGFAEGVGCLRYCTKDGHLTYGDECCSGRLCKRKAAVITGVLVSVLFLLALGAFCVILRWRTKLNSWIYARSCLAGITGRAPRIRQFTYQELEKATRGFEENQKVMDNTDESVHVGELHDGSLVSVQKIQCETEQVLMQALEKVEILSQISHRNVAQVIGCCINSNNVLVVVHEFISSGCLDELLKRVHGSGLDWHRRINIAIEVANALAYLQFEIHPPIYLYDLKSSDILVGIDYSAKITCYKLLNPRYGDRCSSNNGSDDVYNFGLVLLEIIVGTNHDDVLKNVLPKISSGHLEDVVDPSLGFRYMLPQQKEEVERIASIAVHCLLSCETNSVCIIDVAKELIRIVRSNTRDWRLARPTLEVTFSESSLLQMISMSPDSRYVP